MNISKFLESLMESVDGEGNPHWKRDLIVAIGIMIVLFSVMFVTSILSP